MDADTALELVKKGATVLALDVPPNTLFGIDTQVLIYFVCVFCIFSFLLFSELYLQSCVFLQIFMAGPNFKGIKMIPPGIHFIYYSSSNRLTIHRNNFKYSGNQVTR